MKDIEHKFKCNECDFRTVSEQGLKSHMTRKHKEVRKEENLKFPRTCDFCEEEFKNKREMNKHMRMHSYTHVQFQCDKCDFFGGDFMTMEVHLAKHHNDKFECGLCEYVAKNLDTLEMHLSTCEIFTCNKCKTKFKNLQDLKTHFTKDHESKDSFVEVFHVKQSRENKEEFEGRNHFYRELFPELLQQS